MARTPLADKLSMVNAAMQATKEGWVASKPENTDVLIYCHFWRGDELVATTMSPVDRDTGLNAAFLGASGFNATTVSLTFESFHSSLGKSPITGEQWQQGEMQYVFETDPQAAEKGWVAECLTTTIHDREGGVLMASQAYQIEDGKVLWLDLSDWMNESGPQAVPAGYMHQFMTQVMSQPMLDDQLRETQQMEEITELLVGGDPEVRHFHMDVATVKAMIDKELIVGSILNARPGTERATWLNERFPQDQINISE